MSLLTEASLIVTPNAYNVNKLYSVIPNTTLGDMDVSRGSSATRVNEQGLIEIARTNLVLQSQTLENASWSKVGANSAIAPVVTANAGTAPDGTMTADRVQFDCVGSLQADRSYILQTLVTTIGTRYYQSIYVKAFSSGQVGKKLRIAADGLTGLSSVITLTANWERVVLNELATSATTYFIVETRGTYTTSTGTTADVLLWGAQLEAGETATEYIPTVASIRTKFAGITQDGSSASNIPRIDYTGGGCPSILVEPQRTNYCLNSNDLSQSQWINLTTNTTITRITSGGIAGEFDRLTTTGTGTQGRFVQTSILIGTNAVFSVYLKGTGQVSIGIFNAGQTTNIPLTLTTQWQRFETKITTGIAGYMDFSIYVFGGSTVDVSSSQLEFATYATSYIPTVAGTVTRTADVISKTGISSLIGQIEGTLYAEVIIKNTENQICASIQRDSGINHIFISQFLNKRQFSLRANNVTIFNYNVGVFLSGTNKVALVYNTNGNISAFLNGVKVSTLSTSAFAFSNTLDSLQIFDDGYYSSQNTTNNKSTILFKTALTDDQCILLTGPSFSSYPEMASALIYTLQ